jgi:RNA polymerase sigma-70 factor (ECF subfamily)
MVREALGGGANALRRLLERLSCVPAILRARNQQWGGAFDEQEIEDLVQDSLVVIWKKLEAFNGRSKLENWAFRICTLEMMNALRAKRRRPTPMPGTLAGELPSREEDAVWARLRSVELLRCLERVGRGAEILRLKHFEDLTFEAIAEREGVATSTVKSRYYRALTRLRDLLETVSGEGEI